jgi:hypothetical protein
MGKWKYSSAILDRHWMCQLHVPAALSPSKVARYPLDKRLGAPPSRSGYCGEQKNLALPGIEPRHSSQTLYRLHFQCREKKKMLLQNVTQSISGHKVKSVAGGCVKLNDEKLHNLLFSSLETTHQPNPMQLSPSWEAVSCAATQEFLNILCIPKVHFRFHKRPTLVPIQLIQSILPHPTSLIFILILSSHLRLGLPSGLIPSRFPTNIPYAFHFSPFVLHSLTWSF